MKIYNLFFLFLSMVLWGCKKDSEVSSTVLNKLQAGEEVVIISENDYPENLIASAKGEAFFQIRNFPKHDLIGYNYDTKSFSSSLRTNASTASVTISSENYNNQFTLNTAGSTSPGVKVYSTDYSGDNSTWVSSCFPGSVSVQFNEDVSTTPIVVSTMIPNPITILGPHVYTKQDSVPVNSNSVLTWNTDPNYRNAVIVSIKNIPFSEALPTVFLTPDDGALSFRDFSHYLDPGYISIEISRLEYETITSNTEIYRIIAFTSSTAYYKLNK